ncbi:JAB domain-containing protein [Sphingobium sp. DEHP117]|uniref:JAB domain-containing protein n=1 Tax=Sphingobium sp. DEHP117 TaxID=2993436 RepID=UPI00359FB845
MHAPHWFAAFIDTLEPRPYGEEVLAALFINRLAEAIGAVTLHGERHRVSLPVREIVRRAAQARAALVLLLHTHPSGNSRPSRQDILLTHRLEADLALAGMALYDHIILAPHHYFSFRAAGLLNHSEKLALPLATPAPPPYRLPPALPGSRDSGPVGE